MEKTINEQVRMIETSNEQRALDTVATAVNSCISIAEAQPKVVEIEDAIKTLKVMHGNLKYIREKLLCQRRE